MASQTNAVAASGIIYTGTGTTPIALSSLFTTYNIAASATAFDANIHSNDGSYLIGPNGTHYGFGQLTPDILIGDLSRTFFVPSGSGTEATLIAFNSDTADGSFSYPAVSVVLGLGTLKGFDYPFTLTSTQIAAIPSSGYSFAVRYYCSDGSQDPLSLSERLGLESKNVQICTVWENKSVQASSGVTAFSGTAGTVDATQAISEATTAQQEAGSAIYFAIDMDTTSSIVDAYLKQIASVFNDPNKNVNHYKFGVYGSGYTCQLGAIDGASYTWLNAASYGWTNTGTYTNWNLSQVAVDENNSIPYTNLDPAGELSKKIVVGNAIFGVDVDIAKTGSDFGAFGPGSPSPPPPPSNPQIIQDNPITVSVGGSGPITAGNLSANETGFNSSQLIFTVTSGPSHGTLVNNSQSTVQFSQTDLNAGAISYLENGSVTSSDSFSFQVTDTSGGHTTGSFTIQIQSPPPPVSPPPPPSSPPPPPVSPPPPPASGLTLYDYSFTYKDGNVYYGITADDGTHGYFVGQIINTFYGSYDVYAKSQQLFNFPTNTVEIQLYYDNVGSKGKLAYTPYYYSQTGYSPGTAIGNDYDYILGSDNQYHVFGGNVGEFINSSPPPPPPSSPNDFSGDGRSDILFQNSAGLLATWQVNDTTVSGGGNLGNPGPDWTYIGSGDFNGDHKADLLFRNQNGVLATWQMSGTNIVGGGNLGNPGAAYSVVGIGDFNGDGASDILFRNTDGSYGTWEVQGSSIIAGNPNIGAPGGSFVFKGLGDFNGDGRSDILFEDAGGNYSTWLMNGTSVSGRVALGNAGPNYLFRGIGDFNGDGTSDVLFQNAISGDYATWKIQNDQVVLGGGTLGNPGPNWVFTAIGDYNGDGNSDILFRNANTGLYATWDVNGTSLIGGGNLGNPGAVWSVSSGPPAARPELPPTILFQNSNGAVASWNAPNSQNLGGPTFGNPSTAWAAIGRADFNGDGQIDVLFRSANGTLATWQTDGNTITAVGTLGNPGGSWSLKGLGDFNGDGRSDILFEDAGGNYASWDIGGTSIIGGGTIGNPGPDWAFQGIGDFNGDGKSDVLFMNSAHNYAIWELSNTQIIGGGNLGGPGGSFVCKGVGDFNGDGKSDILFEDAGGNYATWDLSGTSIIGGGNVGNPGPNWQFQQALDLNGDHKSDILFKSTADNTLASWHLDDTSIVGGGTIGNPGSAWHPLP
jgi:hypothetical protein